ncbi:MAG: N-acetylmuramoyl-L-alanine amidase, partial [Cyanobacteriota bacterium]|nr:N-acetylmuramoyl-L-alanine amidase [Cyanobacteriota bacterium]
MASAPSRPLILLVVGALQIPLLLAALPARAASALAAWALGSDGVLQLRTSRGARLEAFFQPADGAQGAKVWIDF